MKIKIQSIHFDADQKLLDHIQEKVKKLNHFYDGIISGDVILRVEKNTVPENKIAEIRLLIPGNDLFTKKQCKTFEEAIDTGVEALTKQVQKHKEKVKGI
jgi:putative sigma-54 modulation protein